MTANDLTIYEDFAAAWWDPSKPQFRSLNFLTPFRLELITSWIGSPRGKKILDLGCGGGLLSVPLIEQEALVTGVDLSGASIAQAALHAHGRGTFIVGDARTVILEPHNFDVVLLADVVDHIPDYQVALAQAYRALKPGGVLFVGTINRTWIANLIAIVFGEGLGYIPKGTHDYQLFIKPEELHAAARSCGFQHVATQGEAPALFATLFRRAIHLKRSPFCHVAYSALYRRPYDAPSS
jgi:2-polyprenyl-6-hydroxyphenyl methylase/3-demethylubiquinone-9 3-methyltransferase